MTEPWVFVDGVAAHLVVAKDALCRRIDAKRILEHKVGNLSEVDEWVCEGWILLCERVPTPSLVIGAFPISHENHLGLL